MRIIIAGGRDLNNYKWAAAKIGNILRLTKPDTIISGGATGADYMGELYAEAHKIDLERFLADWDKHGKAAGHIRNREMAENATHLIAFWDGKSRGTNNMIETAKMLGLKVRIVYYDSSVILKNKDRRGYAV